jgi:hypothetical protein
LKCHQATRRDHGDPSSRPDEKTNKRYVDTVYGYGHNSCESQALCCSDHLRQERNGAQQDRYPRGLDQDIVLVGDYALDKTDSCAKVYSVVIFGNSEEVAGPHEQIEAEQHANRDDE